MTLESTHYDLTIIGVGILGVLSAYEITKIHPNWRILLIDRSLIGQGATLYSLGAQFPFGKSVIKKAYTETSLKKWAELEKEIPNLPIQRLPFYGITDTNKTEAVLSSFVDPSVEILNNNKQQQFFSSYPNILIQKNQIIIGNTWGSIAKPFEITLKISKYLQAQTNIELYESIEIENIEKINNNHYLLTTSHEQQIKTERVLITTGPWISTGLMNLIAKEKEIRTKKIVSFHIQKTPTKTDPLIFFYDEQAFLLPDIWNKRWLFSFTVQEWDCPPDVQKLTLINSDYTLGISLLQKYCPSFIPLFRGGRVFCDAYSKTQDPLVFEVPQMPNVIVAGAGGGSGFRLAPGMVQQLCEDFF